MWEGETGGWYDHDAIKELCWIKIVVDCIRCEDVSGVDHVLRLANEAFGRSFVYMSNPLSKNGLTVVYT